LVVAAGGNNGVEMDFYPASYQNVISVANTDFSDIKAMTSNYGYTIDVSAPGESVYATYPTNNYSFQSGTSMASPVVAGAAAIVRSYFPAFNAFQAGEQLKVTADNHYPLNNSIFENKLGDWSHQLVSCLNSNGFSICCYDTTNSDR
jgi:serine protease